MFVSTLFRSITAAVLLLQAAAAHAQQPTDQSASGTFHLKVCNSRNFIVYAAVKYNSDGSNYVTHGWWPIEPKHCFDIGDFRKGDFYVFAQTFDSNPVQVFVAGSDLVKLCVVMKVNFTYSGTRTCNATEYRDFSHLVVSNPTLTWTL